MICCKSRIATLGIVLFTLTACASVTNEYKGPTLPSDQTALVESGSYTNIESLDGRRTTKLKMALLPGEHTVQMRPSEQEQPNQAYLFYSWVTGSVTFVAEAGHRYLVYVDFVPTPGPADEEKGSGYTWTGYVLDRSTGKRIADTGQLPLGVAPRGFPTGFPTVGPNIMYR
jgi:hypothetical protein